MWGVLEDFDVVIDVSKLEMRESNSFQMNVVYVDNVHCL